MHEGVREYGCEINQGKTQLNFDPAAVQRELATPSAAGLASVTQAAVLTFAGVGWSVAHEGGQGLASQQTTHRDDDDDTAAAAPPEWLQWCGLYIHTGNLSVRGDYSRLAGTYIADTISLDRSAYAQAELLDKMFSFVQPKCHAMLLDQRLNSACDVWLNLYQVRKGREEEEEETETHGANGHFSFFHSVWRSRP